MVLLPLRLGCWLIKIRICFHCAEKSTPKQKNHATALKISGKNGLQDRQDDGMKEDDLATIIVQAAFFKEILRDRSTACRSRLSKPLRVLRPWPPAQRAYGSESATGSRNRWRNGNEVSLAIPLLYCPTSLLRQKIDTYGNHTYLQRNPQTAP